MSAISFGGVLYPSCAWIDKLRKEKTKAINRSRVSMSIVFRNVKVRNNGKQ
jgi:hypothetical protein